MEQIFSDISQQQEATTARIGTAVQVTHKETSDEMNKIINHGSTLLLEKGALLLGMKDELRRTSEHYNKVNEMQSIGKREAEMEYKEKVYRAQEDFDEKKKNMTEQYEHLLSGKEEDLRKFMVDADKYITGKK